MKTIFRNYGEMNDQLWAYSAKVKDFEIDRFSNWKKNIIYLILKDIWYDVHYLLRVIYV